MSASHLIGHIASPLCYVQWYQSCGSLWFVILPSVQSLDLRNFRKYSELLYRYLLIPAETRKRNVKPISSLQRSKKKELLIQSFTAITCRNTAKSLILMTMERSRVDWSLQGNSYTHAVANGYSSTQRIIRHMHGWKRVSKPSVSFLLHDLLGVVWPDVDHSEYAIAWNLLNCSNNFGSLGAARRFALETSQRQVPVCTIYCNHFTLTFCELSLHCTGSGISSGLHFGIHCLRCGY